MPSLCPSSFLCLLTLSCVAHAVAREHGPWACHTIDNSSRGADGAKLADVNGDGLPDVATGWEEGGLIRVYLNPGPMLAKRAWPAVTVGKVASPEDAVLVDLDADGATDVVSCCERHTKSVYVHWAPKDQSRYLDPAAWRTDAFPVVQAAQMFMFCLPMQVDGAGGIDLVCGSKGRPAEIGWLQSPANPRDVSGWKWHALHDARWVMSLMAADMDHDGDPDILASDREGAQRGCFWLENKGPQHAEQKWPAHRIGPLGHEATFLDHVDLDRDDLVDVVAPDFSRRLWWHRRTSVDKPLWETRELAYPSSMDFARCVRVADIDVDGNLDIVLTSRSGEGKVGAAWMSRPAGSTDRAWDVFAISGPAGPKGLKFDLIQLNDLDGDGDLDLLTTDEHGGLGLVWYENPTRN